MAGTKAGNALVMSCPTATSVIASIDTVFFGCKEADKTPIVYQPSGAYGGGWFTGSGPTCVADRYVGDASVRSAMEFRCLGKGSCSTDPSVDVQFGDPCVGCLKASCTVCTIA